MDIIKRSVIDWLNLLTRINNLKKEYGSQLLEETIWWLGNLEQKNITSLGNKAKLIDVLVEHKIDDVILMKKFLKKIKVIYNLELVINRIKVAKEECGINDIAFIVDEDKKNINVDVLFSNSFIRRCFFTKDVFLIPNINFYRGKINLAINPDFDFIVDEKDFDDNNRSDRILYTNGFYFNSISFPTKEEMDLCEIDDLRNKWMDNLLFNIAFQLKEKGSLVLDNLNDKEFDLNSFDVFQGYSVFSDGTLYDCYGNELEIKHFNSKKIIVKNALILLICKFNGEEIVDFKLAVNPVYFKDYIQKKRQQGEKEYLQIILSLLEDKQLSEKYGISR